MPERRGTPYETWAQEEGIPIVRGYSVADVRQSPLEPWQRKGGLGAFILLEGGEGRTSAYLCEIPPGASLKPQRHLFEEMIYILEGQGETKVWNEGGPAQTFSWHEYSLFATPLNAWHQHRNTGDQPAKYVAITDAPLVFNTFRNPKFIFDTNFVFSDRYNSEKDYFDGVGKIVKDDIWQGIWQGGLIPDVREPNLPGTDFGAGFRRLQVKMSNNSWGAHIAQIEVGTYKKAHRHAGGAHIIIAQGTGYALMWPDGGRRVKADFQKGGLYSPPEGWWHQHFNTGTEAVKQIAFRAGTQVVKQIGLAGNTQAVGQVAFSSSIDIMSAVGKIFLTTLNIKQGGDGLEWEDEDPEIRREFVRELAKRSLEIRMPPIVSSKKK